MTDDSSWREKAREVIQAGEPPGHPHQMRVVQILVGVVVPAPPPHPKPARVVPQRVVGVEHDPVHTVVTARQKIPVPLAETIDHAQTVEATPTAPRLPGG